MKSLFQRVLAIAFTAAAFAAHAGGPLGVCHNTAVKYAGAGTVSLNYDRGTLGTRTNAAANTIVTNAINLWTNVTTATVTLSRGTDLPVDVTTANAASYLNNFSDGINPVIYDTDGTITDQLLGTGARSNVLGFAGSAWSDNGVICNYVEGRAVINGFVAVSDGTMTTVLAHEIGHLIGLDHAQLDNMQGLASNNYPLMYPIAYRNPASLHEDDVAAITSLYPDTNVNAAYGTLTGTFVQASGTPIRGANIWAQGTGGTFSVVSDYLMQGTGYFRLLLPPGTYTLHAEAIDTGFTGGSSVGPYSDDSTDLSFQAPLYSGSTPMAPVTMSPQITITAGCSASVTFRINGTGTMGTTCAPAATPSAMTSPATGSTLSGSSVTFTWNAGTGTISDRYLAVGTTLGGGEIYAGYQGASLSRLISGIPTDGRTIYVRLSSWIGTGWVANTYTYTAATVAPVPARSTMTSPPAGSTLLGATMTFTWDAGSGVTARYLSVGTTLGGSQIYGADQGTALSRSVSGLPTNGSTVYVRLTSTIGGVAQSNDYTYTAVLVSPPVTTKSMLTSPVAGSTLPGSSVTFAWTAGSSVTSRYLVVGTTAGGSDLYSGSAAGLLSQTVNGIPTDGRTIYVALSSWLGGAWQSDSATYTASSAAPATAKSLLTSPTAGSTLPGSTVTFSWTTGTGVTSRYLVVGTTAGGSDLYSGSAAGLLSQTVSGIPTDGRTIYVALSSWVGGAWQGSSATYTAASGGGGALPQSVITSPAPGSVVSGSTVTLVWSAGTGVTSRYLSVGTTPGGSDLFSGGAGGVLSQAISGLPRDGRTIYVSLASYVSGTWLGSNATFVSGP